jgi:hypothetical protein
MLKLYLVNGKQFQFEEGEQPEGAVELKAEKPEKKKAEDVKVYKPANKARRTAKK